MEFRGADIPTYAEAFQGPWETKHDQIAPGEVRIFNQGLMVGQDLVYNEHVDGGMAMKGHLLGDTMALVIPDEKTQSGRFWGTTYPERSAILVPPGHEIDVALPKMRSVVLMVQETEFREHFANASGCSPCLSDGAPFLRLPARSIHHLQNYLSSIAAGRVPIATGFSVCQEVAETLATEVPIETEPMPLPPRSRVVREAIWMLEDRDPSPSVRGVAEELGMNQRTLRNRFLAVTGQPPGRYLQIRLLNQAYRDLQRADPSRSTVTEIAMNLGFTELGRFALRFRKLFGSLPSDVLKQPPPSHRSKVVLGN